jgi:hypothetical protein
MPVTDEVSVVFKVKTGADARVIFARRRNETHTDGVEVQFGGMRFAFHNSFVRLFPPVCFGLFSICYYITWRGVI